MSKVEERLAGLGLTLPTPVAPIANYVPFCKVGSLVHISGQVSLDAGGGVTGIVGQDVDIERAKAAAQLCGLNLIAQIKAACDGDLDRLKRIIKLGGFVQAGPDFYAIPEVINGCSDLMVAAFGDKGRHARAAVGVASLPADCAVEVDGVFEVA